jgi:hypothetical protein
MDLGMRKIRSAGRSSGSIEITLPALLQFLEGVECRLLVRDGPRPEIVLQAELSAAQDLLQELWQKLRQGLGEIEDLGDFSPSDFSLALFPPRHWQERPPLAYADALAVLQYRKGSGTAHRKESGTAHRKGSGTAQRAGGNGRTPEALVRLLAFLAVAAAYRLGLEDGLALAFGDAVAYLITGTPAGLGTDFERGMAHRAFWGNAPPAQTLASAAWSDPDLEGTQDRTLSSLFTERVWERARPGLQRVYEQFRAWQKNPETYAVARKMWYRALMMEMGARTSSVEAYVGG